jgi:hypothetical protein
MFGQFQHFDSWEAFTRGFQGKSRSDPSEPATQRRLGYFKQPTVRLFHWIRLFFAEEEKQIYPALRRRGVSVYNALGETALRESFVRTYKARARPYILFQKPAKTNFAKIILIDSCKELMKVPTDADVARQKAGEDGRITLPEDKARIRGCYIPQVQPKYKDNLLKDSANLTGIDFLPLHVLVTAFIEQREQLCSADREGEEGRSGQDFFSVLETKTKFSMFELANLGSFNMTGSLWRNYTMAAMKLKSKPGQQKNALRPKHEKSIDLVEKYTFKPTDAKAQEINKLLLESTDLKNFWLALATGLTPECCLAWRWLRKAYVERLNSAGDELFQDPEYQKKTKKRTEIKGAKEWLSKKPLDIAKQARVWILSEIAAAPWHGDGASGGARRCQCGKD